MAMYVCMYMGGTCIIEGINSIVVANLIMVTAVFICGLAGWPDLLDKGEGGEGGRGEADMGVG